MKNFHTLTAVAAAALLASCGGGGGSDRGVLVEAPQAVATLTAAQIDTQTTGIGLRPLTGAARCDVKVVALHYETVGREQ